MRPLPSEYWSDGANLPHVDSLPITQSVTIRLADALPPGTLLRWADEVSSLPVPARRGEFSRRLEAELDRGIGRCWLQEESIAELVAGAIRFHAGKLYVLHAWALMPNHGHLLFTPREGTRLRRIMHALKSWTSHEASKRFGVPAPFWAADYYDRFIRDESHLRNVASYIERNPVVAGLDRRFTRPPWNCVVGLDGAMPASGFAFASGRDGLSPLRSLSSSRNRGSASRCDSAQAGTA